MKNILSFLLIITFISSCGVITKTRYSNGLKIDVGNNLFAKKEKIIENKAVKAVKHQSNENTKITAKPANTILDTAHLNHDEIILNEHKGERVLVKNKITCKGVTLNKTLEKTEPKALNEDKAEKKPIEKTAKIAGWIFYSGLVLNIIAALLGIPTYYILSITLLIGYILAFVALAKIRESKDKFRGRRLAISIIVIYSIFLLLALILAALIILFFLL